VIDERDRERSYSQLQPFSLSENANSAVQQLLNSYSTNKLDVTTAGSGLTNMNFLMDKLLAERSSNHSSYNQIPLRANLHSSQYLLSTDKARQQSLIP